MFLEQLTYKRKGLEIEVKRNNMAENPKIEIINFDITHFCPALMVLWKKHITDEEGYSKPPEEVGDFGVKVEINYNPIHPDTAITDCEAPVKFGNATHPGVPQAIFLETIPTSVGLAHRFKIKCNGCRLKLGGFTTTTRY